MEDNLPQDGFKNDSIDDILDKDAFQLRMDNPHLLVPVHPTDVYNGIVADNDDAFPFCYCYVDDPDNPNFYAFVQLDGRTGKYQFIRATTTMTAFYPDSELKNAEEMKKFDIVNSEGHIAVIEEHDAPEDAISAMCSFLGKEDITYWEYGDKIMKRIRVPLSGVDVLVDRLKHRNVSIDFDSVYDFLKSEGADEDTVYAVMRKLDIKESSSMADSVAKFMLVERLKRT